MNTTLKKILLTLGIFVGVIAVPGITVLGAMWLRENVPVVFTVFYSVFGLFLIFLIWIVVSEEVEK